MKTASIALAAMLYVACAGAGQASAIPTHFESRGEDRTAIERLLSDYTTAVSSRNQALFESLLLNKDIPFSAVSQAVQAKGADHGTQNYDAFRKGVFEGPAFQQRFQDVRIDQDGALAQVSLVFVNTDPSGSSWGWKTMQLLKIDGRWKIASEFFTGHG
jgi:hypothetical protein